MFKENKSFSLLNIFNARVLALAGLIMLNRILSEDMSLRYNFTGPGGRIYNDIATYDSHFKANETSYGVLNVLLFPFFSKRIMHYKDIPLLTLMQPFLRFLSKARLGITRFRWLVVALASDSIRDFFIGFREKTPFLIRSDALMVFSQFVTLYDRLFRISFSIGSEGLKNPLIEAFFEILRYGCFLALCFFCGDNGTFNRLYARIFLMLFKMAQIWLISWPRITKLFSQGTHPGPQTTIFQDTTKLIPSTFGMTYDISLQAMVMYGIETFKNLGGIDRNGIATPVFALFKQNRESVHIFLSRIQLQNTVALTQNFSFTPGLIKFLQSTLFFLPRIVGLTSFFMLFYGSVPMLGFIRIISYGLGRFFLAGLISYRTASQKHQIFNLFAGIFPFIFLKVFGGGLRHSYWGIIELGAVLLGISGALILTWVITEIVTKYLYRDYKNNYVHSILEK
jgi:hypothetical protein